MYSFEGEFKRKPQQSFGGASRKVERNELLNQAQAERNLREQRRRQFQAATTIQAAFKGFLVRKREKEKQRTQFDELSKNVYNSSSFLNCDRLGNIISKFLFFYFENDDKHRLVWLTQMLLKEAPTVISFLLKNTDYWLHKLQKLSKLNIIYLKNIAASAITITVPLRYLEVFTSYDSYVQENRVIQEKSNCNNTVEKEIRILERFWIYLINNHYFDVLCTIVNNRVPDSLISSIQPPTPLAASLLDLILKPLLIDIEQKDLILQKLFEEVFAKRFTYQISCFLLPAFAARANIVSTDTILSSVLKSNDLNLSINPSPWLMYAIMLIMRDQMAYLTEAQTIRYIHILRHLLRSIPCVKERSQIGRSESDDEEEEPVLNNSCDSEDATTIIKEIVLLINHPDLINSILNVIETPETFKQTVVSISCLCHFLLDSQKLAIHNFRLLYTLAFKPSFLRQLWHSITNHYAPSVFGQSASFLQYLSQGIYLNSSDQEVFLPQLTLFCAFLNHLLSTLHDFEFYGDENNAGINTKMMPFSLHEMAAISLTLRDVCMGLIDLAYPETRPSFNEDYIRAMQSVGVIKISRNVDTKEVKRWDQLFKVVVILLRQLYSRDSRRKFCPDGQWIAKQFLISFDRAAELHFSNRQGYGYVPFVGLHPLTREQLEEHGPPPSALEVRQIAVLREFPFVIRFRDRVKIFHSMIQKDKEKFQGELSNFQLGPQIHVLIRRNFIYEDAFDNLSMENEANLKLKVLVQLVNAVGLDEVGIDGGGIFKEFLNELLKTCFDPNRGFFKTTHDRLLYPNPGVHRLVPDFMKHYFFIGRMLGKAIYENMLVELPFAGFFLAKILAQHSTDVDIHHLASLDPVIYKNLLYLKTYEGNVSELGLDFTVMSSDFGENEVIELKPGGSNIPVTESNRITYIHLMADYKLNKQIKAQCQAFKEGLANVIDLEWLYMFDPNELQTLISGAQTPIDIEDLKAHTNYAGGYGANHPVIQTFWQVVESFDERRRRQLLKFVTSCSRPPLLGFKELSPAFCIQNAGREPGRLPTASTCMNLLKLPEFQDEKTLRAKLVYAVESGAGFELS